MKRFYQLLFLFGSGLACAGGALWAKEGFPFSLSELSTTLSGTRPWRLAKDSHFFLMALGLVIAAYCAVELKLMRWEEKRN